MERIFSWFWMDAVRFDKIHGILCNGNNFKFWIQCDVANIFNFPEQNPRGYEILGKIFINVI